MTTTSKLNFALLLAGTALATPLQAQVITQAPPATTPERVEEIVVVGTQIRGCITQALPVTVLDANQIDAPGAELQERLSKP